MQPATDQRNPEQEPENRNVGPWGQVLRDAFKAFLCRFSPVERPPAPFKALCPVAFQEGLEAAGIGTEDQRLCPAQTFVQDGDFALLRQLRWPEALAALAQNSFPLELGRRSTEDGLSFLPQIARRPLDKS